MFILMFAQVIVDILRAEVDRIFEYSFDDDYGINLGSRVVVPFGSKVIEGIVIGIKETSEYQPEKIKKILRVLEETPALTDETLKLSEYVSKTCFVTRASALRLFLPVEMRKGKIKEKFKKFVELNCETDVDNAVLSLSKTAVKQKDFLFYLQENGKSDYTKMCELFGNQAIKSVEKKGFVLITEEKILRSPYKDLEGLKKEIKLTEKQNEVINGITNTDKTTSLLFGVTGSGKTEVYLELIDREIKKGKSAIMLVPEISLTPQMLKQLRSRFGENAAILHSGLSAGERFDEWWRIRQKEAKIVIGARSAIFAPLENIGIIIIDEEHDGSYISETSPRYTTVDIAKFRAKYNDAKLVLGSATPSVESFLLAKSGEYNLERLPDRINKKPLPNIEVVDMRKEIRHGNNSPFSVSLKAELEECLNKKNQAIIFLNQRGYSRSVICTECGHVVKCPSCDVSLTYHKEDESLLCHYCGAKFKMVESCPECGSTFLRYGGFGTERVVLELKKLFPNANILRMDKDTTQNKEGHFKILNDFSQRKADILVGTQMIAKGHDFPFVTLVGILDADMSLHFSDFKSHERTFQLLTQVAGRSGRADEAGKVVLQTYSPEHPVLMQAIRYDYEGFFEQENSVRSTTGFPPYSDIIRVLISGVNEENTINVVKSLYTELEMFKNKNADKFIFFGCMKSPIKKLQNKFRYQVLMRIKANNRELLNEIFSISNKYDNRSVSVYMELNPNNLS
ncbi:MAG: primosomal protein N' [Clostridia bacterium]|nr:primosomal protein N' [Clostridia bacterium]